MRFLSLEESLKHNCEKIFWNIKNLWSPELFCLQVNTLWWGNSSYVYKRSQPALRALLRLARRTRGRLTGQSYAYPILPIFLLLILMADVAFIYSP